MRSAAALSSQQPPSTHDTTLKNPPSTMMRERLGKVVRELEDLRLDHLQASLGLPLPPVRQIIALARLRPSSMPLDKRPPPPSMTPGGGSSSSNHSTIRPRIAPLPTWTIHQTRVFGQVFLDRVHKAARAQGLGLDAYAVTAAMAKARAPAAAPASATRLEAWHREVVAAFNGGRSVGEIAQQQQQQGGGPVEEAQVLRWLAEAEALGPPAPVAWERLGVSPQLLEAASVAVDVALALEADMGGAADALALEFPLECLLQLLPDYGSADVLAALCVLRHRQRSQQKQQPKQPNAKAAALKAPPSHRPPLLSVQPQPQPHHHHQQRQQAPPPPAPPVAPAPAAPASSSSVPPLDARVMAVLQAQAGTAEGLTVDECVRALPHASRAEVEACLVGFEESFMAYRGPGGGFKLL